MKVMVLGIRGIPNVQGGVETHAEHLYERLATLGCDVGVVVRAPYVPREQTHLGSIRLHRIWSPTTPGVETLIHSFLGVLYAAIMRPDILHIHAIGPSVMTPLARLLGLRVVITHHGPDYDREKWGALARLVLRLGERWGVRWSHACIAISKTIEDIVRAYDRPAYRIPNGVDRPAGSHGHVESYGLTARKYFLQVGRIVPEKRQLDLIRAFMRAKREDWRLAIVGGAAGAATYDAKVRAEGKDVVFTGVLKGEALEAIYANAGAFVLPSSHEGFPIAMLEALSYGLPVIASDIPANREVDIDSIRYFPVGNVDALAQLLSEAAEAVEDEQARLARMQRVLELYEWERIAELTKAVYLSVMNRSTTQRPMYQPQ